jgi:hypothetical protein
MRGAGRQINFVARFGARGPQLLGQIYGNHASPKDAAALLSSVSPEERTIAAAITVS